MFLRGYQRYGKHRISVDDANTYVAEMATLAHDLGAEDPPSDGAELEATSVSFPSRVATQ